MAEKQDKEQKTEEPTGKRMQKAREQGQVPRSQDLAFGAMLVTTAGILLLFGHFVPEAFRDLIYKCTGSFSSATARDLPLLGQLLIQKAMFALMPFYVAFVPVVLLTSFMQFGFHYVPQKLKPKPNKIIPNLSPTKFVNVKSLIETATSLLKLVFLATAYVLAVWSELETLMATSSRESLVVFGIHLIVRLLLYVGITMLVIGVIDYAMKRWDNKKELRMTKEEVKQEAKDAMGDPQIKSRIKTRQRQIAMQRMMDEVPNATVVVTNPTHYAVALKYTPGMGAPRVVARGADFVALRIRDLAKEAGVPVMENPPLARALHGATRPGDEIPANLYQAVAELLAAVMKTRRNAGSHA